MLPVLTRVPRTCQTACHYRVSHCFHDIVIIRPIKVRIRIGLSALPAAHWSPCGLNSICRSGREGCFVRDSRANESRPVFPTPWRRRHRRLQSTRQKIRSECSVSVRSPVSTPGPGHNLSREVSHSEKHSKIHPLRGKQSSTRNHGYTQNVGTHTIEGGFCINRRCFNAASMPTRLVALSGPCLCDRLVPLWEPA